MYEKLIEQARAAVGAATKRVELAEKALTDARALRLSASAVAGLFRFYTEQRATAYAEYVDRMLLQTAERIDAGAPDLLMDRGGADSDALHFFLQETVLAGIEARCKRLFPATGDTLEGKAAKVRKAEQELAAAASALSDAVSALRRLQQAEPGSMQAGVAYGA